MKWRYKPFTMFTTENKVSEIFQNMKIRVLVQLVFNLVGLIGFLTILN